jgi:hypothetical protein
MTTQPMGVWEAPLENVLSIVGVHAIVLRTGKVLYFSFFSDAVGLVGTDRDKFVSLFNNPELGSYQIWDPATGTAAPVQEIGRNSFCAGQVALADGTILVAGGQDAAGAVELYGPDGGSATDPNFWSSWGSAVFGGTDNGALTDLHTYDPVADSWEQWPNLQVGRYYPTCAILWDGTAFIAGGLANLQQWVISGAQSSLENDQFETVPPGELFAGTTPLAPFRDADQYPILCLLPGTHILFVHIETQTFLFDLDSTSFINGAVFMPPGVGRQTYPMQTGYVLLPQKQEDTPRILIVGGSTATGFDFNTHSDAPAVQQAFIFTFNAQNPAQSGWRTTHNPPGIARLLCDTVLLPDGTVFVVNGIVGGAAAGNSQAVAFFAEIFDPATETFTTMNGPNGAHPRGYHSTAVLLPDARVAIAGNTAAYNKEEGTLQNDDLSIQVFDPPYLFAGPRPKVAVGQTEITYGSTVTCDTSAGPDVVKVMMMRPCAVTHTVDMNQRAIELPLAARMGAVDITLPTDKSLAPPGYYMLFFLSADGVPSVATWIKIFDGDPTFPPLYLGTYSGNCVIEEVFDGDLTLESIDQGAKVTLESRHGSITIKHKIDQHSYAKLTAHTTVSIGEKIDQHSVADITAGGDVTIGQSIDQESTATITSKNGKIEIGQKIDAVSGATLTAGTTVHIGQTIDQHSNAVIVAQGDVNIDDKIDQHSTADITSVHGAINIGQKIDQWAIASLKAGTTVHIGQKIDQHAQATILAQGDVNIDQKLDQHTLSSITSVNGSVTVSQGMSGNCDATIVATNGNITMDTIDGGCTLNWNAKNLNCPNKKGTIVHI